MVKAQTESWAMIPESMIADKNLSDREFRVLCYLVKLSGYEEIYASQSTVAEGSKKKRQYIPEIYRSLKNKGYIDFEDLEYRKGVTCKVILTTKDIYLSGNPDKGCNDTLTGGCNDTLTLIDKTNTKDNIQKIIDTIVSIWNKFAEKSDLPKVIKLTKSRSNKISLRIKESEFDITKIITNIEKSDFLMNEFKVPFDWIITNDKNYLKILEGNYGNKTERSNTTNRVRAGEEYSNL